MTKDTADARDSERMQHSSRALVRRTTNSVIKSRSLRSRYAKGDDCGEIPLITHQSLLITSPTLSKIILQTHNVVFAKYSPFELNENRTRRRISNDEQAIAI